TPADADSIDVFRKQRKVAETSGNLRKPLRHALPACGSARSVKIEMVEMGSANCANCANCAKSSVRAVTAITAHDALVPLYGGKELPVVAVRPEAISCRIVVDLPWSKPCPD